MRNTRKTLIITVLLAELAVGAYLVFHKGDEATETHVTRDGSQQEEVSDPVLSDTHVTAGSIAGALTAASSANDIAVVPKQAPIGNVVSAEPAPPQVENAVQAPQPAAKLNAEPAPAQAAANTQNAPVSANPPVTQSAPETQNASVLEKRPAPVARADASRDYSRSRNPRSTTSAMTDQLVRESAQLDPALPPPNPALMVPAPVVRADPSHRSNPVAAAMTDSLVRDSARLDPSLPPPKRPGTQ
ncbi:hypothetical protein [Burkholderia sp. Leaf177]|uniref:hypothetical protein n=1 Tax=Burkholderia sp. Leaf177 TaxID=1736287 RepID=UPI0012E373B5|nr:hypothetical protein [Burkholderia sp. Leaf177]